ncbi:hypothetical protein HOD61_00425 [archaeon]|jgi:hypothetical protein|nr:hypothetical protein [archaeon]
MGENSPTNNYDVGIGVLGFFFVIFFIVGITSEGGGVMIFINLVMFGLPLFFVIMGRRKLVKKLNSKTKPKKKKTQNVKKGVPSKKKNDKIEEKEDIKFKIPIMYSGGHMLHPIASSLSKQHGSAGELHLTDDKVIFIQKSAFGKEKMRIEIPIKKIINKELRCDEASAINLQQTAGMTAALGPWGLIAGMAKKIVLLIPFKDKKGMIQRPMFVAINGSQKKGLKEFNHKLYEKL